jgi:hypothetical protein
MAERGKLAVAARQFAGLPPRDFAEKALTRLLRRRFDVRVFRLMTLDGARLRVDGDSGAALPAGFAARFLAPAECLALADDPNHGLRPEFVRAALARGDACLAIFDGAALASFGWYAQGAAPMPYGLSIRFDPAWVYLYHIHTRPAWRGRRLHGSGMAAALRHYASAGRSGIVTLVEVINYESLRAMRRTGCTRVGSIYAAWRGGRPVFLHSPGCRRYAVRLAADPRAADGADDKGAGGGAAGAP